MITVLYVSAIQFGEDSVIRSGTLERCDTVRRVRNSNDA